MLNNTTASFFSLFQTWPIQCNIGGLQSAGPWTVLFASGRKSSDCRTLHGTTVGCHHSGHFVSAGRHSCYRLQFGRSNGRNDIAIYASGKIATRYRSGSGQTIVRVCQRCKATEQNGRWLCGRHSYGRFAAGHVAAGRSCGFLCERRHRAARLPISNGNKYTYLKWQCCIGMVKFFYVLFQAREVVTITGRLSIMQSQ